MQTFTCEKLTVKKADSRAEMDERGDKTLRAGDILHVRYETYDPVETELELCAIVGDQPAENMREI
jgi:hypothetical protein